MVWAVENVPNEAHLYLRVHVNLVKSGLTPSIFREHGGGMSTDWNKYATPAKTRAGSEKPASSYGVVTLEVAKVRVVPGLSVTHAPLLCNRAHTEVFGIGTSGPLTSERRLLLWKHSSQEWTIQPDAPVSPPTLGDRLSRLCRILAKWWTELARSAQ